VGRHVAVCKAQRLRAKGREDRFKKGLSRYLVRTKRHVPTVIGPENQEGDRFYITDHHHRAYAMHSARGKGWIDADQDHVIACILANRSTDLVDSETIALSGTPHSCSSTRTDSASRRRGPSTAPPNTTMASAHGLACTATGAYRHSSVEHRVSERIGVDAPTTRQHPETRAAAPRQPIARPWSRPGSTPPGRTPAGRRTAISILTGKDPYV
jgi:hypothetical protein